MTWNNRLTQTASGPIGQLGPSPAVNTAYSAVLSAADLAPFAGQTITLRMSSTGADNLRIWSREATSAAYRPTLVLTYTAVPAP